MELNEHFCDFRYCELCVSKDVPETEEPCNECLTNGTNLGTDKPVCFKERKGAKKKGCEME